MEETYISKSVCINRQGIQLRHMKKNKPFGGNEAVPKPSSTQRCSWSVEGRKEVIVARAE